MRGGSPGKGKERGRERESEANSKRQLLPAVRWDGNGSGRGEGNRDQAGKTSNGSNRKRHFERDGGLMAATQTGRELRALHPSVCPSVHLWGRDRACPHGTDAPDMRKPSGGYEHGELQIQTPDEQCVCEST